MKGPETTEVNIGIAVEAGAGREEVDQEEVAPEIEDRNPEVRVKKMNGHHQILTPRKEG